MADVPIRRYRAEARLLDALAELPALVGRAAWATSQAFSHIDDRCDVLKCRLWEHAGALRAIADREEAPVGSLTYVIADERLTTRQPDGYLSAFYADDEGRP